MLHLQIKGRDSFGQRHRLLPVVIFVVAVAALAKVILLDGVIQTHLSVHLNQLLVVHDRLEGTLHTLLESFVSLSSNDTGLFGVLSDSGAVSRTDTFLEEQTLIGSCVKPGLCQVDDSRRRTFLMSNHCRLLR